MRSIYIHMHIQIHVCIKLHMNITHIYVCVAMIGGYREKLILQ